MQVTYPHIRIRRINGLLGFSRQGYYQYWRNNISHQERDQEVINLVKGLRKEQPKLGGRKLFSLLKEEFYRRRIKMGRDAFFDLLATHHLPVKKRKRKIKTTFSKHRFYKYPNLIRNLPIDRPNQVWVSDMDLHVPLHRVHLLANSDRSSLSITHYRCLFEVDCWFWCSTESWGYQCSMCIEDGIIYNQSTNG